LDIRRLNKEIAAFSDPPAEAAILYSQTSTLQIPPEMLTWQTTPYLAELKKSYEASQYLDAKVTFITEGQIRKGWLDRYKLVIIPAVRNIPSDVVEKIWTYASQGGTILMTPESFLGDEYNHPEDYLKRLGVKIRETQRPTPGGVGSLVQGYDQSFSQHVTFASGRSAPLRPVGRETVAAGMLEAQGVQQRLEIDRNAKLLYSYPDGTPAVVRVAIGEGAVYYAAASLKAQSYSRLLDSLFNSAGIQRQIRTQLVDGSAPWKVEARFAQLGRRKLLYVVNFNDRSVDLRLQSKSGPIEMLHELRDDSTISGDRVEVEPHQTYIYELKQQVN
jgi:beta-galactosidase GanA